MRWTIPLWWPIVNSLVAARTCRVIDGARLDTGTIFGTLARPRVRPRFSTHFLADVTQFTWSYPDGSRCGIA
jgi:hypothetical protein